LTVNNKPWKNESYHDTFESADAIRHKLIRIWKTDPKHEGMQVKVKWLESKNKFAVKTRMDPNLIKEVPKEEKKNGKSRKRNKKDTGGRMFDPTASIWKVSSFSFFTIPRS